MTKRKSNRASLSNHIAEWFGYRTFPVVADSDSALSHQRSELCPFISQATGSAHECVKSANSKGVCTISTNNVGIRQDWLVCPFRALEPTLLEDAVFRMFKIDAEIHTDIVPVTVLESSERRAKLLEQIESGSRVVVYFQNKLGGEISLQKTDRSPEMNFDSTMVEIVKGQNGPTLGKYGIFEIQTMDFHGSYLHAVTKLRNALDLHAEEFPAALAAHPEWAGERIEGPNIANVFKRTFYQMMFKFQIGAHESSAGCVFAIPKSVWDSWQRHLGAPSLIAQEDGTYRLAMEDEQSREPSSWIYVFDVEEGKGDSPSKLSLWRVIATDAPSLSHYALAVAPDAALEAGGSVDNLADRIRSRMARYLPELT